MSIGVPTRLANGIGNWPDAAKWMDDYDYLTALIYGNFSLNGGMELWNAATTFTNPANGATVADSWTVLKSGTSGATADVTREATIIDSGVYSMKVNITGAGSANSIWDIHQSLAAPKRFGSETVLLGVRCRAGTANKLRCKVYDGANSSYSTYHAGDSSFQLLTAQLAVASTPSEMTLTIEINPSDFTGAVYIDSVFLYVVPSGISTTAKTALGYSPLNAGFLPLLGGLLTGPLAMGANKITGLAAGTTNGDAVRYEQLTSLAYLLLTGGTMSGDIAMGTHKVTGLAAGTTAGDAVRYEDVIAALLAGISPTLGTITTSDSILSALGKIANARIVQVVSANTSTDFTTTSSTFQATNLTLSITPKSTANKILVFAVGPFAINSSGINAFATIARNGTSINGAAGGAMMRISATGVTIYVTHVSLLTLDSPASTSAQTYAIYIKNSDNTTSIYFGSGEGSGVTSYIVAIEIGA